MNPWNMSGRPNKNTVCFHQKTKDECHDIGFSPMLSSLLACTLKDGFCNQTAFDLLNDIYPYVCGQDRAQIGRLLGLKGLSNNVMSVPVNTYNLRPIRLHAPLTNTQKFLNLIRVLRRYGGMSSAYIFDSIERIIRVKCRYNQATDFGNIVNAVTNCIPGMNRGAGGPFGNGGFGNMGNIMQMMSMMNMMNGMGGGMNPAGLANMMNGMGGAGGGGPNFDPAMLAALMNMMNGGGANPGGPGNPANGSGGGGMNPSQLINLMGMMNGMGGGGNGQNMDFSRLAEMMNLFNQSK